MLQKGHTGDHRTSFNFQFSEEEALVQYYTVYGVATQLVVLAARPLAGLEAIDDTALDPLKCKLVLVPKRLPNDRYPEDAEPHVSGLACEGDTVLGLAEVDGVHYVVNTSWDPDPLPPGNWRKRDRGRWTAKWVPNPRRPAWEHLDDDPFGP